MNQVQHNPIDLPIADPALTPSHQNHSASKVVLVTGGASGIGNAAARLWASKGYRVCISDINANNGQAAVEAIKQTGGDAFFCQADVSDPNACKSLLETVIAYYGRLDIAFNNAGIAGPSAKLADLPPEQFLNVLNINLNGVFNCMHYELQHFRLQGTGAIINTASIMGLRGTPGASAYCAAKHGVIALTKCAALEHGREGIRINAICPGFIETPLLNADIMAEDTLNQKRRQIGLRRFGLAEEVAELVYWLGSDKASYVTGAAIGVDGGFLAA